MIILGIDPARQSGAAILHHDAAAVHRQRGNRTELIRFAAFDVYDRDARDGVVQAAIGVAKDRATPLVVVAEEFAWRGRNPRKTLLGAGAAWGAWQDSLHASRVPAGRVHRVNPTTWYSAVLGGAGSTAARKLSSKTYVEARFRLKVTDDEADAICIALWGTRNVTAPGRLHNGF